MSRMADVDIELQELVAVFSHGPGWELLYTDPSSTEALDGRAELLEALEGLGWHPPTVSRAMA